MKTIDLLKRTIPTPQETPTGTKEVTPIPAQLEDTFRAWVKRNNIRDLDHPQSRYDYRGAFLAGVGAQVNPTDNLPHWPDTFKQHGHPTFSVESKYSRGLDDGGTWEGESFTPGMGQGVSVGPIRLAPRSRTKSKGQP